MILSTYNPKVKWKRGKCERCGRTRYLCQHHVTRRNNSDKVVWICSNGYANVLYPDSCHQWIHDNPSKAREEGYYQDFDTIYRKKPRKKTKKLDYIKGTYILKK